MSARKIIEVGTRFNRLVVLETLPRTQGLTRCRVRCDCGSELVVLAGNLRIGNTTSCGCASRDATRARNFKHGMASTPEYRTWKHMIGRCHNPGDSRFRFYGARGITVCDRWRNSFEAFYEDMGPRGDATSIDRIDNDGNYEPGNCRWATWLQQQRNSSRNRHITIAGKTQCLSVWLEESAVSRESVWKRLKLGWSIEEALFTPRRKRRHLSETLTHPQGASSASA